MKKVLKPLCWIAGCIAAALIIVEIALSPKVMTSIVNNVATDYVDGELIFSKATASMFRHFPNLSVDIKNVSLTYPTERYEAYEQDGTRLLFQGKGEIQDTLASFESLSIALNPWALLVGQIKVPYASLEKPRVFAKTYAEGVYNWDIFNLEDSEQASDSLESSTLTLPTIVIGKMHLGSSPFIVYCSQPDTLYASVRLKEMKFNGRISTTDFSKIKVGFKADSLLIAGRMGADTVGFSLDYLGIKPHKSALAVNMKAKVGALTANYGRMVVPIDAAAKVSFPKGSEIAVDIDDLSAHFADIPLSGAAKLKYCTDSVWVDANMEITKAKIKDVLDKYGTHFIPALSNVQTSAALSMGFKANGWLNFDMSRLPSVEFTMSIPEAPLKYEGTSINTAIGLDIWARGGDNEPVDAAIEDFHLIGDILQVNVQAFAKDVMGEDPLLGLDSEMSIVVDSLSTLIKEQTGIDAYGVVSAKAKGSLLMSQCDIYKVAEADLTGFLKTDKFNVYSDEMGVDMSLDSLNIVFGTLGNQRDTTIAQGTRLLGIVARLDKTYIRYQDELMLSGANLSLNAWNDAGILDQNSTATYYPFSGKVEIGELTMMDADSTRVALEKSTNTFTISPSAKDKTIPVLTLKSSTKSVRAQMEYNRAGLRDLNLSLSATKATDNTHKKRVKTFMDSLSRRHPEMSRDSLIEFMRKGPAEGGPMPNWITEDDFKSLDMTFKLDEAFAKYYKEWNFNGSMTLSKASLMTPMLPLRNSMDKLDVKINTAALTLNNLTVNSGTSTISANGRLSGLRKALLENGPLDLKLNFTSDSLNANELLAAYEKGEEIMAKISAAQTEDTSDAAYLEMVAIDTLANAAAPQLQLIVIPKNIRAEVNLDAQKLAYSTLEMQKFQSEIVMKDRCIQLVNTYANTNIGDLSAEAFYSTQSKSDLKAGFNIEFTDITADEVINMLPAVDSLMPMVRSFHGKLNLELAATTELDTCMNIILPSLNGIMRLSGKDLCLKESEDLYKIAKILRFKDPRTINIDDMVAEALLSDNKAEIFPCVISVDRYSLAISGIQNLDQSFNYHVSIIKSPLLIRFGVNFNGPNFEDMKFKLGKAKFKKKTVPVFSDVIDETKVSLSSAIHDIFNKGVNETMSENSAFSAIEKRRRELGYINPANQELEALSAKEEAQLENDEESAEGTTDDDENDEDNEE